VAYLYCCRYLALARLRDSGSCFDRPTLPSIYTEKHNVDDEPDGYHTVTANNIPVSTDTRREKDAGRESSTVRRRCRTGSGLKDNTKMHTVD
jgi:hypothetical protein